MRAAIHGGLMQVPALIALPRRVLKLMLHEEQPYAGGGRAQHDRKMHEQERLDADEQCQRSDNEGNREIGCHRTGPRLPTLAHEADRYPVLQEKLIGRSDTEHDQRVTVETVFQTAPPRKGPEFANGQRIEIADTAAVEVAAGGVMNCMRAAPAVVGREREHANDAADPVVRQTAGEKRAVAAVVLDHKQTYEKAGSRNRDKKRSPGMAEVKREPCRGPQRYERQNRDCQLDNAAEEMGGAVVVQNALPTPSVCRGPTLAKSHSQEHFRGPHDLTS